MAEREGFDMTFNLLIYIAKLMNPSGNAPIYAPTNHCLRGNIKSWD